MRVLLAGATGTIGRCLIGRLRAAGYTVLGLTRTAKGVAQLREAGAEAVRADVLDRDALLNALTGHRADAVVHQATAIDGVPRRHRDLHATDALRDHGTANLLLAAEIVGARRFLTQSFFLGYGYRDHGAQPVTEDHPFAERTGHHAFDRHMDSMHANEERVLGAPGLEGVALRYGMFYGPEPATRQLVSMARRRLLPVPRPSGVTSLIHVHDAAAATVAALDRGRPGQAYNIVDDEPVDFATYVRAVAERAGAPAPRTVPAWLLRPMPYMHALMVTTRIRPSHAKATRELGWAPSYPSFREGLADLDLQPANGR